MDAASVATILEVLARVVKVAVDLGPTVIKGVEDAKPFAQEIYELFKGTKVTDVQLDALEARVDALADELQQPLPPEEV